jgi:hypothetical protein
MGQTEAIAGYLYHKLGHSDGMTLEDAAKSAALVSVSHQVLSPRNLTTLEGIPKPQTLIYRHWISSSDSQSKPRKMPIIQLAESSRNPVPCTLYPIPYTLYPIPETDLIYDDRTRRTSSFCASRSSTWLALPLISSPSKSVKRSTAGKPNPLHSTF